MGTKQFDSATDLITFTRASGGTALRKISYGSELVTNGTFTGTGNLTGWTLDGDATNNNGVDVFNATAGASTNVLVTCNGLSAEVGKVYKITYDRISGVGFFIFGGVLTTISGVAETTTSYVVATSTGPLIYKTGSGGSTGSMDNVSVKEVTFDQPDGTLQLFNSPANVPRIEYNADGTVKGLLIEEARTNLLPYSNNFSYTTANDSTRYYNVATAPDGTQTADQMVEDTTTSGNHRIYFSGSVVSAATYTFSVFAKSSNRNLTLLAGSGFGEDAASFDLSNGVVLGSASGGEGVIQDVGNGWYRCSLVATNAASNTNVSWQMVMLDGDQRNYTGDGSSSISLYGAQVEAGAFPTSYIPTTGSTATRAADFAQIPTSAFGYNNDKGSLVIDVLTPVADQFMTIAYFNTSSYLNSRGLLKANTSTGSSGNHYVNQTYDGASTLLQLGTQTQAVYAKLGLSYGDNEKAVRDGGTVLSGTSRYPNPTRLHLGGRENGLQSQCWIKSIKYYPRRLSDTQLQELTT